MAKILDNNQAANKICEILRAEGEMDLGDLGMIMKENRFTFTGTLLKLVESFPEKFDIKKKRNFIMVKLKNQARPSSASSSSAIQQTTSNRITSTTLALMKELKTVVTKDPGLNWQQMTKLQPTLQCAIEEEAKRLKHTSPLDFLSKWPNMFSIQIVDGKNCIFPANQQAPATQISNLSNNNNTPNPSNNTPLPASKVNEVTANTPPLPSPLKSVSTPLLISKIKQIPLVLVDSRTALDEATKHLSMEEQLAVDCEGVNLGKNGPITLIQIASGSKVYLFDMLVKELKTDFVSLLKQVLESQRQKIFHDCRRDSEALYFQYGIQIKNVLDTQVLFGLYQRLLGSLNPQEADTKRIGLNKLLEKFNLKINSHKKEVGQEMETNPRYWETRPLTSSMIQYAAEDVSQLIELADAIQKTSIKEFTQAALDMSLRHSRIFTTDSNNGYLQAASIPQDVPLSLRFENGKAVFSQILDTEELEPSPVLLPPFQDLDFQFLLKALPQGMSDSIKAVQSTSGKSVTELVVDQYRHPQIRYNDDTEDEIKKMTDMPLILKTLYQFKGAAEGEEIFTTDNRTGIPGSLHRISAIRDKKGDITGLTYRIGRHVAGVANLIQDIIQSLHASAKAKSLLVLGPPGVGKTTLLRDITKMLADELKKRVIVVDTSNEIGGDSEPPHACIGRARRMQVPQREQQHEVLIEAVQNHNPQVIVIDEIGTSKEVEAARTISQRGVTLVGTAHGVSLSTLMKNPQLRALVGGVQPVILSAQEAQKRAVNNSTSDSKKTVLERAGAPTFDILIEVLSHKHWRVYTDVGKTVDDMLLGKTPTLQERWQDKAGNMFARLSKLRSEESSDWLEGLFSLAN